MADPMHDRHYIVNISELHRTLRLAIGRTCMRPLLLEALLAHDVVFVEWLGIFFPTFALLL
jgi:hypothetical protein